MFVFKYRSDITMIVRSFRRYLSINQVWLNKSYEAQEIARYERSASIALRQTNLRTAEINPKTFEMVF